MIYWKEYVSKSLDSQSKGRLEKEAKGEGQELPPTQNKIQNISIAEHQQGELYVSVIRA